MIPDTMPQATYRPDPVRSYANVVPGGFNVAGLTVPELAGHIVQMRLVRKSFDHGCLVCHSRDGLRGRDDRFCRTCDIPACRDYAQIELASGDVVYTIDLAASSARNLAYFLERRFARNCPLQAPVRLTVLNQGNWGEVCFNDR